MPLHLTTAQMILISLGAGVLMNSSDFCVFAFEEGRKGLLGNDRSMLGRQGRLLGEVEVALVLLACFLLMDLLCYRLYAGGGYARSNELQFRDNADVEQSIS